MVAPLGVGTLGGADLVGLVALGTQTTVALASCGKATQLAVLLGGGTQPVGTGVLRSGVQEHGTKGERSGCESKYEDSLTMGSGGGT